VIVVLWPIADVGRRQAGGWTDSLAISINAIFCCWVSSADFDAATFLLPARHAAKRETVRGADAGGGATFNGVFTKIRPVACVG